MIKNFWHDIDNKKKEFTKKELKICSLIEQNPFIFASSTTTELTKKFKVSQSSISRFCQKLGFNGFSDFRLSLLMSCSMQNDISNKTIVDFAQNIANTILRLANSINEHQLTGLAQKILNANTIYTNGYGVSDIAAYLLSFKGMISGVKIFNLPTSTEVEALHIINNQDMVILFSAHNASHTNFFSMVNDLPKSQKPHIVLITSSPKHPFAKKADDVVVLPYMNELDLPVTAPFIVQIAFSLFLIQKIRQLMPSE